MFITADQILCHLVGDYILQSDWMANAKRKRSVAAAVHAVFYSLPFLFFRPSLAAWAFIAWTHFAIDRWALARYVVWAKNFIAPRSAWPPLSDIVQIMSNGADVTLAFDGNGYSPDRPIWLTTWLYIIADNTMHLYCNGFALNHL